MCVCSCGCMYVYMSDKSTRQAKRKKIHLLMLFVTLCGLFRTGSWLIGCLEAHSVWVSVGLWLCHSPLFDNILSRYYRFTCVPVIYFILSVYTSNTCSCELWSRCFVKKNLLQNNESQFLIVLLFRYWAANPFIDAWLTYSIRTNIENLSNDIAVQINWSCFVWRTVHDIIFRTFILLLFNPLNQAKNY